MVSIMMMKMMIHDDTVNIIYSVLIHLVISCYRYDL